MISMYYMREEWEKRHINSQSIHEIGMSAPSCSGCCVNKDKKSWLQKALSVASNPQ